MTPAERLLRAADLLDTRASEATEGPWWNEADRATGLDVVQGGMVEQDLWLKVAGHVRSQDARYIATMHPEVGKWMARWLRTLGEDAKWLTGTDREYGLALADLVLAGGDES